VSDGLGFGDGSGVRRGDLMGSGFPWTRTAATALSFALVWSALLVVGALVLPAYGTASQSATEDTGTGATSTAPVTTGTETLVGVNGQGVLIVVGIPLLVTMLVAAALAFRRRRIGWVLTCILGLFNLLAMLSVGIFFLPTTLALVVACAATERRRVVHPADEPAPA
jgi:hypothetical protein